MDTLPNLAWAPTCMYDVHLVYAVTNYFSNLSMGEYFKGIAPLSNVADIVSTELSTLCKFLHVWLEQIEDDTKNGVEICHRPPTLLLPYFPVDVFAVGLYMDLEPSDHHKPIHPGIRMFMKDVLSWYDTVHSSRSCSS